MQYRKQLNSIGKDPNYDFNAKWNHQAFYSTYRSRGVRKLVIPVGITRSERVMKTILVFISF